MDSIVTIRFFKIKGRHASAPPFQKACKAAIALGAQPSDREREIGSDYRVRMERFEKDQDFFHGEIVRVQRSNIPPEATKKGLTPLKVGGLGHAVAFRYHPTLSIIAVQFDNRAVSLNRIVQYLSDVDKKFSYIVEPIVTRDAWQRYQDGNPRKFEIAIASPSNLAEVEGKVGALTDAGRKLGEIADAPLI